MAFAGGLDVREMAVKKTTTLLLLTLTLVRPGGFCRSMFVVPIPSKSKEIEDQIKTEVDAVRSQLLVKWL